MHDEKKPGDVLKVPGDALDDVADDVRYGIYTFITSADKPRELIIPELVQPLAQQGDLTSAYITLSTTHRGGANARPSDQAGAPFGLPQLEQRTLTGCKPCGSKHSAMTACSREPC